MVLDTFRRTVLRKIGSLERHFGVRGHQPSLFLGGAGFGEAGPKSRPGGPVVQTGSTEIGPNFAVVGSLGRRALF